MFLNISLIKTLNLVFLKKILMISNEQFKKVIERLGALRRYL